MTLYYQTQRLSVESLSLAPQLREVVALVKVVAGALGWEKIVVTSIFRTLEENRKAKAKSLVHVTRPHRAMDLRTYDVSPKTVAAVTDEVNRVFVYDPNRPGFPVAISRPHGNGPHIHLQVHPNTRRRS